MAETIEASATCLNTCLVGELFEANMHRSNPIDYFKGLDEGKNFIQVLIIRTPNNSKYIGRIYYMRVS